MSAEKGYRLWVNARRTVLVRLWPNGRVDVARRDDPDVTWGPPVALEEESPSPEDEAFARVVGELASAIADRDTAIGYLERIIGGEPEGPVERSAAEFIAGARP